MKIYIPTRGRVGRQLTLRYLRPVQDHVWLVVPEAERHAHDYPRVLTVPSRIQNLSMKRQWLLENTDEDKWVQIDDDLYFYRRKSPGDFHLCKAEDRDIEDMYSWLDHALDDYAHVAVSPREGNNAVVDNLLKENYRALRVLGYRSDILRSEKCRFDRIPVMSDFDMTLQLLRKGFPNVISFEFAHNQRGSQDKGGCSIYRTAEMMEQAAHALAKLHPGFVKVVRKKSKVGGFWSDRPDVQVRWQAAYKSSQGFDLGI